MKKGQTHMVDRQVIPLDCHMFYVQPFLFILSLWTLKIGIRMELFHMYLQGLPSCFLLIPIGVLLPGTWCDSIVLCSVKVLDGNQLGIYLFTASQHITAS